MCSNSTMSTTNTRYALKFHKINENYTYPPKISFVIIIYQSNGIMFVSQNKYASKYEHSNSYHEIILYF